MQSVSGVRMAGREVGPTMARFVAVLLILVCSLTYSGTAVVHALSCEEPGSLSEEVARSSVVFKGKVRAANKDGRTIFKVQTAWKGIADSRIEMYDNGWDPYQPGQTYLVLGANRDGKLRTQLCGWSGPWDAARENAVKDAELAPISIAKKSGDDVDSSSGVGGDGSNAAGVGGYGSNAPGVGGSSTFGVSLNTSVAWTIGIVIAVAAVALAWYRLYKQRRR